LGFRVWRRGSGFGDKLEGLRVRMKSSGIGIHNSEFRGERQGFRVYALGFGVWGLGLGFRV
jgi:hypothetical protein